MLHECIGSLEPPLITLALVPKSQDYFIMFQDKSMVDPFPIPLVILGGKYDVFQVLY